MYACIDCIALIALLHACVHACLHAGCVYVIKAGLLGEKSMNNEFPKMNFELKFCIGAGFGHVSSLLAMTSRFARGCSKQKVYTYICMHICWEYL